MSNIEDASELSESTDRAVRPRKPSDSRLSIVTSMSDIPQSPNASLILLVLCIRAEVTVGQSSICLRACDSKGLNAC